MPGYLDTYGAGEEQREQLIRRLAVAAVALLALCGGTYLHFRNYRQEKRARRFFEALNRQDYEAAYRLWGCPCRDYAFAKFMEDWGPGSAHAGVSSFRITDSEPCGSSVVVEVEMGKDRIEKVWVDRDSLTLSFPPWPECPSVNRLRLFWKRVKERFRGRS